MLSENDEVIQLARFS